jgi:DNA-binding NtrC family response regulator
MNANDRYPGGLVGDHPTIKRVHQLIRRYAPTRTPVLVLGETGTGKELVARAIHASSPRSGHALEILNCAAIPSGLAESELFGHARGAFTGATRDYAGAFERASGGTLFLDEIGEMPLELQPKLLRVLEDGYLRRVGDERPIRADVRLVAATHRNLELEADRGRFRLDLFHRLAVGLVRLPALRQRRSDIPKLARHFLCRICEEFGAQFELSPAACSRLSRAAWPGNVRALRNALERAATSGATVLEPHHFDESCPANESVAREEVVRYAERPFSETQREIYQRTLVKHRGNRTAAAAELRIPKSTFFDQLRTLKITV